MILNSLFSNLNIAPL